jgi:hypothetical protein
MTKIILSAVIVPLLVVGTTIAAASNSVFGAKVTKTSFDDGFAAGVKGNAYEVNLSPALKSSL